MTKTVPPCHHAPATNAGHLAPIPGLNYLECWVPARAEAHPQQPRLHSQAIPMKVRQAASTLVGIAMHAAAGGRAVATLSEAEFSEQVRRHLTARLRGGHRLQQPVQVRSMHVRVRGQLLDAVGSVSAGPVWVGYLAMFEPNTLSTHKLRMRNLRVL